MKLLQRIASLWNDYQDEVVYAELQNISEFPPEKEWPGPGCSCFVCAANRAKKVDRDTLVRPASGFDPVTSDLLTPLP